METAPTPHPFRHTRQPSPLLRLIRESFIITAIITAIFTAVPYFAPGTPFTTFDLTPIFAALLVVGLLLTTVRSQIHISPDGTELIESRTVLGGVLCEKRSKLEFNKVVLDRDWQAGDDPQPVQYIVKLVGPKTIFYVDELSHLGSADQLAEDLAKALNLAVVKEGCFPARLNQN